MRLEAHFSPCGRYRYALSRIWDESSPMLMFNMLNPSTADSSKDDPTIRRCISFASSWNYGGISVCNLFAYRSTDPEALKKTADPVGPQNDEWITKTRLTCKDVVCAWGEKGVLLNRDKIVRQLIGESYCLKLTKHAHPSHPLYLKKDIALIRY